MKNLCLHDLKKNIWQLSWLNVNDVQRPKTMYKSFLFFRHNGNNAHFF